VEVAEGVPGKAGVLEAQRLEREEGPLVWNRGDAVRQHLGDSAADDHLARVALAA
jgi:hypothetical protein